MRPARNSQYSRFQVTWSRADSLPECRPLLPHARLWSTYSAALAYGELSAFDHLADDARLAPSLAGRAAMSAMAAVEFGHFQRLSERLRELGVTPRR